VTRVVVTGGSGKLGHAVLEELTGHGYEVLNLDRVPQSDVSIPFTRVDLTDFGQTVGALSSVDDRHSGVDAVVHLAAIPGPGMAPNHSIFANNILATYNVFTAAQVAGITDIVWASSETLLGIPFDSPPPYLPVDEEYPARPETSYALAKHLEEKMAAELCRRDPALKMIGLRFSNVMTVEDYERFPSFDADPRLRSWNLWSYIDRRDGAQAVRKALEHESRGLEIFIIANADTVMTRPTAELASELFPEVPFKKEVGINETLLSIDKARRVLGYEPEHTWRDHV
jgi:nucleoside-diphosphate-sugar epimerase